ncbi:MAG: sigma 54-interacting transcriptional regulator [Acidobacteriota bacterium]
MDFRALQSVLLASSEARSVDIALEQIVTGLGSTPDVALARLWLEAPGDSCDTCRMAAECRDRRTCLHLVASAGHPSDPGDDWNGIDGEFRRFPLGVRKVGHVGATGEGLLVDDAQASDRWVAKPEWMQAEGIRSFAGQPLVFRGETLGVLGVFSRAVITDDDHAWLRSFADHAAVAIANARAFEEIACLRRRLEEERDYLRSEVAEARSFGEIVGESPALQGVLRKIELVAATDSSVLILGESGTGKELAAQAIHEQSTRRDRPLVRVNCASIPKDLFESEFFGHVRGSFTGAHRDRTGRFELADGGTIFLDEIGEIPLELQGKLLRVLQEGTFERIGDESTRSVDVRVVAATNRCLKEDATEGRFRQDLYYRLSVFPIDLPPLRERKVDIGPLAAHFLRLSAERLKRELPRLTKGQVQQLESRDWPGNIRELQNVIERAVILSTGDRLALELALPTATEVVEPTTDQDEPAERAILTDAEMRLFERDNIAAALERTDGKVNGPDGAAALLGLKPSTLSSRMKVMGVRKPRRS